MKNARFVALACCAAASSLALAAGNPFDSFKGKMKEGLYEYKMETDMGAMPGMPAGMGKQSHTFQKCVTPQDIERGQMGRGERSGKPPESCEVKNFSQSGNTASYSMVCKDPPMNAENRITFKSDGFTMDMKMAMTQRGGQAMNMTQHMEGKYLGPCK